MTSKLKNLLKTHFYLSIILSVLFTILIVASVWLERIYDLNNEGGLSSFLSFIQIASMFTGFALWIALIIASTKINGESKESSTLVLFSVIYIPFISIYLSYSESQKFKDLVMTEVGTQIIPDETQTTPSGIQTTPIAEQSVVKVSMDHNEKKLHAAFRKKLLSDVEYEFQSNLYKKLKSKEISNDEYTKLFRDNNKKSA